MEIASIRGDLLGTHTIRNVDTLPPRHFTPFLAIVSAGPDSALDRRLQIEDGNVAKFSSRSAMHGQKHHQQYHQPIVETTSGAGSSSLADRVILVRCQIL